MIAITTSRAAHDHHGFARLMPGLYRAVPAVFLVDAFASFFSVKSPGAPAGQEILLNKVSVTPYFTETEY